MIAFLTTQPSVDNLTANVTLFSSLSELLAYKTELAAVVVDTGFEVAEVVNGVRKSYHHYLARVYILDGVHLSSYEKAITVPFLNWETVFEEAKSSVELGQFIPHYEEGDLNYEIKLLNYLFVRTDLTLQPIRDLTQSQYYYYPLLRSFAEGDVDETQWINSLEHRTLLKKGKLIDRVRLRPHCESQHINIIDQCPSSHSIDIRKEELFHCFSCGNVDTRASFQQNDKLGCQQCTAVLRHIGVDYDRTLEQYKCGSCLDIFAEPTVVAKCYECEKTTESGDLFTKEIREFELAEASKFHIMNGTINEAFAIIKNQNFVTPLYLEQSVDWMLDLWKRQETLYFSLILMNYTDIEKFIAENGIVKATALYSQLFSEVSTKIRCVDRIARLTRTQFVLLLPLTEGEGVNTALMRIREISSSIESSITLQSAVYSLKDEYQESDPFQSIIDTLQGKLA